MASSNCLGAVGIPFRSPVGEVVISSNPLSVLLQEIWRSRLYFAVGLVAMVVKYGLQLTSGEVIKTSPGDQVRTDCPGRDDMVGSRGSLGGVSLWLLVPVFRGGKEYLRWQLLLKGDWV